MPSTRSGLSNLYKEASSASKLLVLSRISNQKVLPWMVSSTGAVRCFDTVSLSQKLSLHRHAKVPILIHVFISDHQFERPIAGTARARAVPASLPPPVMQLLPEVQSARHPNDNQIAPLPLPPPPEESGGPDVRLQRDTAGELSFRFHDFSLSDNWV